VNINGINSLIKRHHSANWIKKEEPTICCLQETHSIDRKKQWLRVKDGRRFIKTMAPENRQG
jgi:exonuclease III